MLSGNPESFAIWFDKVESWSNEDFENGCFGYFIGRNLIWSTQSTLGADMAKLSTLYCMSHSVEDERLFNLSENEIYGELCRRAFPEMDSDTEDSDFAHLVSVWSLIDQGSNFFLVESGQHAKLIYGNDSNANVIASVILKKGEFQAVANMALEKFNKIK